VLRRAALAGGIVLHERTPVTRLEHGTGSTLHTPGGRVRAAEVVVATNAWMTGWAPVAGRLTNFGSYIVVTEPVPELLAEIGWTSGLSITDARMFLHYFRTTADGRVIMGSGSGPIGYGGRIDARFWTDAPTAARAEDGLRTLLPALRDVRIDGAWGGPIDVSADHLPFFGTVAGTRVHYGAGYSGSGVGASWMGGQILASLVTRADDEWTALPLTGRDVPRLPPEPLRRIGGGLVRSAILACEEHDEDGLPVPRVAGAVARLPGLLGIQIGTR
jgi:glycine/D-amino acid oxidase-like deaminating enzyme